VGVVVIKRTLPVICFILSTFTGKVVALASDEALPVVTADQQPEDKPEDKPVEDLKALWAKCPKVEFGEGECSATHFVNVKHYFCAIEDNKNTAECQKEIIVNFRTSVPESVFPAKMRIQKSPQRSRKVVNPSRPTREKPVEKAEAENNHTPRNKPAENKQVVVQPAPPAVGDLAGPSLAPSAPEISPAPLAPIHQTPAPHKRLAAMSVEELKQAAKNENWKLERGELCEALMDKDLERLALVHEGVFRQLAPLTEIVNHLTALYREENPSQSNTSELFKKAQTQIVLLKDKLFVQFYNHQAKANGDRSVKVTCNPQGQLTLRFIINDEVFIQFANLVLLGRSQIGEQPVFIINPSIDLGSVQLAYRKTVRSDLGRIPSEHMQWFRDLETFRTNHMGFYLLTSLLQQSPILANKKTLFPVRLESLKKDDQASYETYRTWFLFNLATEMSANRKKTPSMSALRGAFTAAPQLSRSLITEADAHALRSRFAKQFQQAPVLEQILTEWQRATLN
jgi:hypothetical protein